MRNTKYRKIFVTPGIMHHEIVSLSYCPLLNKYYAYDLFETTYQYIIKERKKHKDVEKTQLNSIIFKYFT